MYRIGYCISGNTLMPEQQTRQPLSKLQTLIEAYRTLRELGFDYAETAIGSLMGLSEEELAQAAALHEAGEFSIEVCNCFIPASIPLIGESAGDPTAHIKEAFRRMSLVGADTMVFGSGGARRRAEDYPEEKAQAQIDAFLTLANELAAPYHITIVIEPLNKGETNVINSVNDGADYVRRLQLPQVRLLADAYHMLLENDPLTSLVLNEDILSHIHVAVTDKRLCPGAEDGGYLSAFAAVLRGSSYQGRVSIECRYEEFGADIRRAYPYMRELF